MYLGFDLHKFSMFIKNLKKDVLFPHSNASIGD
jgi:hypothetical protein